MRLKKGIKSIQHTGENLEELRTFTGKDVTYNDELGFPPATVQGRNKVTVFWGDWLVKDDKVLMAIPDDIIKFMIQ